MEKNASHEDDAPAMQKIPKYSRIGMEGKRIYVIALFHSLASSPQMSGAVEQQGRS